MAFKFFNPATLLPTPREAVRPPPPDNTMGVILGSVMENIGRVAREKREFDALVAEGNATADYLDTISPNLGAMVRNRVQGYAPDPFLGYGGVDAKTERASLLKGAFEFSKLENERQANAARAAAANASGLAQFNNYQYKLQAAQSAYDAALRNASQANAQYNAAVQAWDAADDEEFRRTRRRRNRNTRPVKDTTWDKAAADAKVTLDRYLNMSQSEIIGEATPKRAGVVPSIGQSNNVTSIPLANADGTAVTPVTQVVADSDLPAVPGDGATLFGSPLDAAPPPVNTPAGMADASLVPGPTQLTEKVYAPGDIVPPADAAPAQTETPRPPLLSAGNAPPAPVLNPPVPATAAPDRITSATPAAPSDPAAVEAAQVSEQGKRTLALYYDNIEQKKAAIDAAMSEYNSKKTAEDVKKEADLVKQKLASIQAGEPGSPAWNEEAKIILDGLDTRINSIPKKSAAEKAADIKTAGARAGTYTTPNGTTVTIVHKPVDRDYMGNIVYDSYIVNPNTLEESEKIDREIMAEGVQYKLQGELRDAQTKSSSSQTPVGAPVGIPVLTPTIGNMLMKKSK